MNSQSVSKKTAVITGCDGQDAWYLKKLLDYCGVQYTLIGRRPPHNSVSLANLEQVEQKIATTLPTYVFHLAAASSTRHNLLQENQESIVAGTLNILESCRRVSPQTRVLLCGSGLQFERLTQPISEDSPFAATSAYACARIQSVYLGRYFRQTFGIPTFVAYLFGHESPRRPDYFSSKKLTEAARNCSRDDNYRCQMGDLSVIREFAYAGDIVCGFWKLINQEINPDTVWEANICSGRGLSLSEWAKIAFQLLNLDYQQFVEEQSNYTAEYQQLVGKPEKILQVGWQPTTSAEQLCRLMLELDDEDTYLRQLFTSVQ